MSWANPNAPNLPDYTLFVSGTMGISTTYLPADSPFLGYAFNRALNLVLNVPAPRWLFENPLASPSPGFEYTYAVYNCAGHIQLLITPDQVVGGVAYSFFREKREAMNLLQTVTGMVSASSDAGTSSTFAVPDAMAQLTIGDLGFMRTHWGREYLAYAQNFGTVWGLT